MCKVMRSCGHACRWCIVRCCVHHCRFHPRGDVSLYVAREQFHSNLSVDTDVCCIRKKLLLVDESSQRCVASPFTSRLQLRHCEPVCRACPKGVVVRVAVARLVMTTECLPKAFVVVMSCHSALVSLSFSSRKCSCRMQPHASVVSHLSARRCLPHRARMLLLISLFLQCGLPKS